jgi:hypothetical protein
VLSTSEPEWATSLGQASLLVIVSVLVILNVSALMSLTTRHILDIV